MRRLRALPLGGLVLALLGAATAVVRGPTARGLRVLSAPGGASRPAALEAGSDPFTTLLLAGSAVVLAAACCWLAAAVAACTWDALHAGAGSGTGSGTGSGRSSFLRPPLVRVLVATCLGVGALGQPPAHAQTTADVQPSSSPTPVAARGPAPLARLLEGLPLPDRTTGGAGRIPTPRAAGPIHDTTRPPSQGPSRHPARHPARHHERHPARHPAGPAVGSPAGHPVRRSVATSLVVAPGDSLWTLTARLLPDGAPVSAVTTGWHLLYAANRTVIGDDPDLLRPGQRLRVDRALTDLARSTAQHSSTTSTDRRSP